MDFNSGGREAIERLVEAYGFSTRQALADHLKVSKSTLATRYMRDIFPSDWVITCALETGVSLGWLSTGSGSKYEHSKSDVIPLEKKKIIDGNLFSAGTIYFDKVMLPTDLQQVFIVDDSSIFYVVDGCTSEIQDGKWLVNIDGLYSIRDIARIPGNKLRITNDAISFDCDKNEITQCGRIIKTIL
ncbi:TPA: phage repressor protein CI [Citrobacter freundii]